MSSQVFAPGVDTTQTNKMDEKDMKDATDEALGINKVMENREYPVYQYSYFVNGNRDEQLVIREDDFEKFLEAKRNIDKIIEKRKAEVKTEPPVQPSNQSAAICNRCGEPATLKSGKSKAGKPYKGIFCSAVKEHVQWL